LVVRTLRHWLDGSRVKVKRRSPASSRLSATARHLSRHLRRKGLPPALDLRQGRGVNHIAVIGADLLVQTLGRVRQQVAVLMHGTPLDRRAVPDGGDGLLQDLSPARICILQYSLVEKSFATSALAIWAKRRRVEGARPTVDANTRPGYSPPNAVWSACEYETIKRKSRPLAALSIHEERHLP
jgi:hypothetical protein